MDKEKRIAYSILLPKQIDDLGKQIIAKFGYSKTELVKQGIIALHKSIFKDYIEIQKAKVAMTPEDKVKTEMDIKEARVKAAEEKEYLLRKGFCDAMGGVELMKGQTRVCAISKWQYDKEYKSEVPFEEMSQEVVDSQFTPDKETCIKWGANIK